MNNFKPGDEIWYFQFPEGCGGFMVGEVELHKSIISHERPYSDNYYSVQWGEIRKDVDLFKSKDEAINAMIKRLEELKE